MEKRTHFLPIETNWFDRAFISVVCAIAIHLIWMRFLEAEPLNLSIWIATLISVGLGFIIMRYG